MRAVPLAAVGQWTSRNSCETHLCHTGLAGATPADHSGAPHPRIQSRALNHITGDNTAAVYFRPQLPPKLQIDTDRINHSIGSLLLAMLSSFYEWLDLARD